MESRAKILEKLDIAEDALAAIREALTDAESPPGPSPSPPPAPPSKPGGFGDIVLAECIVERPEWRPHKEGEAGTDAKFRFLARPSHLSYDDPVISPGVKAASPHVHLWFGNEYADHNSTRETLIQAGVEMQGRGINRSGYALSPFVWNGQAVIPDQIVQYYSHIPASHPRSIGEVQNVPEGLMMRFGQRFGVAEDHKATKFKIITADDRDAEAYNLDSEWAFSVSAGKKWVRIGAIVPGASALRDLLLPGSTFTINIASPRFWNGKDLNAPDGISHMSDEGPGRTVPEGFPICIPHLSILATTHLDFDGRTMRNVADTGDQAGGQGTHAYFVEAWKREEFELIWRNIQRGFSLDNGDMGDGRQLRPAKNHNVPTPRRVPMPKRGEVLRL